MSSRSLGGIAALVTVILLSLAARGQSNAAPAPPGRLIDIGQGVALHIYCTGRGAPTVVLLHGFGEYSFDWALVQPRVSKHTRTCSYDRPGEAWSTLGKPPRGPETAAQELHTLLERAGIKPPYVLVGHSWGGLVVRMYAHDYPGEVAGLVLVDGFHEDEYIRWVNGEVVRPMEMSEKDWLALIEPTLHPATPPPPPKPMAAPPPQLKPPFDKLPPDAQKLQLWAMSIPWSKERWEGGDIQDLRADSIEARRALGGEHPLGKIPLVVISKTPAPDEDYTKEQTEWNRGLQEKLAGESTNSLHIVAKHSGHHVQLDDPGLVSGVILGMLRAIRRHQPVTSIHVSDRGSD